MPIRHLQFFPSCALALLICGLADLQRASAQAGVGTSVYYPQPVPRMSYYRGKYGYDASQFPEAARISDCSIALPVAMHVSPGDVDYMAAQFAKAISEVQE